MHDIGKSTSNRSYQIYALIDPSGPLVTPLAFRMGRQT